MAEGGSGRCQLHSIDEIQKFILAGNATITLVSRKTSTRFTYRIKQAKDDDDTIPRRFWFVSLLTGADNESDYQYLGTINARLYYRHGDKSPIRSSAPSARAFMWFFGHVEENEPLNRDALFSGVEVWHEGKCGRCGRKLTVPDSITSGFGPECINYV